MLHLLYLNHAIKQYNYGLKYHQSNLYFLNLIIVFEIVIYIYIYLYSFDSEGIIVD